MTPAIPRGKAGGESGWGAPRPHRPARWKWKGSFRTSGKEVCLSGRLMYPGSQNGLREPLCCECHVRFGGRLPVPRAEAALPYWVPSSLRPRGQSQKMVRFHIPKTSESCPCLCHCFRGRLPVPRSQAMMPYWVPQVLRSPKKAVKRQRSFRGLQERPLDSRARYNCWRICCDRRLLLKWLQLQAVDQDEPPAPGRTASSLDSLLTLLQTVLRAIGAIRTSPMAAPAVEEASKFSEATSLPSRQRVLAVGQGKKWAVSTVCSGSLDTARCDHFIVPVLKGGN
ncbi:uncharacterized protein C16orf95 homolog [Lepus europaeus]|uniref:uncharacterized protein C16orf95 homolog n=1 Tax=Lepus europaeus TaxID=9983 RepID=UPI002B488A38|nr:uncharacterized protein C16orf95 homolog [Lepus europaeus]